MPQSSTFFDSDEDGNANFSECVILGNVSNSNKTLEYKSRVIYTYGDARPDRCTPPISAVSNPTSPQCEIEFNSSTDPFDATYPKGPGTAYPLDTRAFCTINLVDVGLGSDNTVVLLNTCSYPSQQPNSDPSDCVLIPGKATPSIATTPRLVPQDTATLGSNVSGSVTFYLYKDVNTNGLCDDALVFTQTVQTTNATPLTFATNNTTYSITTDGSYLWKVNYSGDASNNPAESACGTEKYVINVTPDPS